MNQTCFAALAALAFLPLPAVPAQSSPPVTLRCKFTRGQKMRYVILRDPYFAEPAQAMETTDPNAPYRPPTVKRLTGQVQAVGADGTATLQMTLGPEPGFAGDEGSEPPQTRTLRVSARGQVLSPVTDAAEREMGEVFMLLPPGPVRVGERREGAALDAVRGSAKDGLAVIMQAGPSTTEEARAAGHDGVLLQTTRSTRRDRMVFDLGRGQLVRRRSTKTITLSLVMTGRGARGADDFGHVIPTVSVTQTLAVERRESP